MILQYFRKNENIEKKNAINIYQRILILSNNFLDENSFFKNKDYNSSFEIVSFVLITYINLNIQNNINNYKILNEELIKLFVSDLDESLRSKGIGDMSIGKYVKKYVKKFYFRLAKFPTKIDIKDLKSFVEYLSYLDFIKESEEGLASKSLLSIYKKILYTYR